MHHKPSSNTHAAYTIVQKDDQYRVFDKQGKYRRSFDTRALAESWIAAQDGRKQPRRPADQERAEAATL